MEISITATVIIIDILSVHDYLACLIVYRSLTDRKPFPGNMHMLEMTNHLKLIVTICNCLELQAVPPSLSQMDL